MFTCFVASKLNRIVKSCVFVISLRLDVPLDLASLNFNHHCVLIKGHIHAALQASVKYAVACCLCITVGRFLKHSLLKWTYVMIKALCQGFQCH